MREIHLFVYSDEDGLKSWAGFTRDDVMAEMLEELDWADRSSLDIIKPGQRLCQNEFGENACLTYTIVRHRLMIDTESD
jgi:hypothetical protein